MMTTGVLATGMAGAQGKSTTETMATSENGSLTHGQVSSLIEKIYRYPKIELHIHLEATLPMPVYVELARKYNVALPRPAERMHETKTFKEFFGLLRFSSSLLRTEEDLELAAYNYAVFAASSGQIYAEIIINPQHWLQWELAPLMRGLCAGFDRAAAEGYTDCRLLISLMRYQSLEEAMAILDQMIKDRPPRVLGLSIDGDEKQSGRTGERFRPVFLKAKENGMPTTAHAGETSGPEGVRDAIELLEADRIDHGVRAIEDPDTVKLAADKNIPFNVTLSSNVGWLYPDFASHPFEQLRQAGVPITINTDHATLMKTDMNQEFLHAALAAHWTHAHFQEITQNALNAAFCDAETLARLKTVIANSSLGQDAG